MPSSNQQEDFKNRVWNTPQEIYEERLRAVGFENQNRVLDAGCGFGQWSAALSSLNHRVYACDSDPKRLEHMKSLGLSVETTMATLEALPYPSGFFSGVFCYSVLYLCEPRQAIQEIARILEPGGTLYLNTNGLGWYLYNLLHGHNDSLDFSSRNMARMALKNSLSYYSTGIREKGQQIIISPDHLIDLLEKEGFTSIQWGPDASLVEGSHPSGKAFYPPQMEGEVGVYEILAEKRR